MKYKAIIAVLLTVMLCLSAVSCAADEGEKLPGGKADGDAVTPVTRVANEDGEIGGGAPADRSDSYKASADGYDGFYEADCAEKAVAAATEMAGEFYGETMLMPAETAYPMKPGTPDIAVDQTVYNAGTLTAGEWRDNLKWSDWLAKISEQSWSSIADAWKMPSKNRVAVSVVNGAEPVRGAKVVLLDESGNTLWSAVTDNKGNAYLFWTRSGVSSSPNYPDSGSPKSVSVSAAGGVSAVAAYAGEESLTVSLAAANEPVRLDLMFMVDTTGSMSDELEYLKAELKDVVTRAQSETGVSSVRTSVNFYRDVGDEYVVRYFGFKDSIDEAVANISAQRADGGGDYPEAVHTALENAVNGHAWDESAGCVRLMFLVLDAPAHEESDVIASLRASVEAAAKMGIRIIPVMSSGTDTLCEVLFRSIAAVTGGTYVFLTDHSGIGGGHAEQSVGEFTVEKLNDLMVRVIREYCE